MEYFLAYPTFFSTNFSCKQAHLNKIGPETPGCTSVTEIATANADSSMATLWQYSKANNTQNYMPLFLQSYFSQFASPFDQNS